jgi:hypothetical protein
VAENRISLNEASRRVELDEEKARKDKRTAERAKHKTPELKDYTITLDTVNKPELTLANSEAKPEKDAAAKAEAADDADPDADDAETGKKPVIDPVRNETLNIVGDLIELSHPAHTAAK